MALPLPPTWRERLAGVAWDREPEGESGAMIFRLRLPDGTAMFLKYGEGAVADAVADEAMRLRWLQGRVPAARLVSAAIEPCAAWLLTEAVPGRSGDGWLRERRDMLPSIIASYATFLRALHALPVEECPFEAGAGVRLAAARRLVAAGAVDEDDFGAAHLGLRAAAVLEKAEVLASSACGRVVTHGDFSLGNVLLDASGIVTGCIDVGRLGVADPYQDIAIFLENLDEFGPEAQRRFLATMGIERVDDDRRRFHQVLDELF